jgi:CRISPR-associated endonuclease Csn1
VQNELRKVINNLIDFCGRKPDLIRVELMRDVGKSKLEREEKAKAMREQNKRRQAAIDDLKSKGIAEPAGRDIEKWLLWQESQQRCPYTGDQISFDGLFHSNQFDVEHIWPRARSLDDSFQNKTLCRKDINADKGNQTPFEYFANQPDLWAALKIRLNSMIAQKSAQGMSPGKMKRFLAQAIPDDFARACCV